MSDRIIKFRAFIDHNVTRYPKDIVYWGVHANPPWLDYLIPGSTGQFTGLKDKNGKEIYESDRLKDSGGYTWIVFWHNDHACFGVRSEVNSVGSEIIDNVNMEVVGNIYENNSQGK